MELLTPDAAVRIDTTLDYTSRSPHALSVTFHLMDPDPVVWHLDREMVLAGSLTPTGDGEVHLRPADGGRLLLRLGPAGHRADVLVDADRLTAVVRETFALVPQGTEERHIDWRPLLASLGR
ncbi:SsgA family sporulation/cell division regulator [Streptomyces sp. NK15101]|uniref:SsgA family sporulation/cell division regulator n=1 Tax=Streptomyces sp. NK15101 TaxID=2873261 RepID=UPI001CED90E0|nr:SsgA family sporulation/cell division regulator [Streptomyces sp. NK15101]